MGIRNIAVPVCYGPSGGIVVQRHLRCEIVEGHRYADDEPTWSQFTRSTDPDASGSHALANPYDSGIHERPSGAFRLPEQRPGEIPAGNPYALKDPLATGGHARPPAEAEVRVPVRGTEYPTIRPTSAPESALPPPPAVARIAEPTTLVPPVPAPAPATAPERVYQSRRPVSSFVVAFVMVVLLIPVVRLLIDQTFTGDPTPRGIVPAVLLTLGYALTGIGLFSVARSGPISRETWLRPPVAYLPVGLILLVAAGFAVA